MTLKPGLFRLLNLFKRFRGNLKIPRCYSSRNVLSLEKRGIISDIFPETSTNDIVELLHSKPQTVYAGFDPTADSLHVGNLLVLLNLLHWQRGGHQAIVLLGGATARVGDPSGKNKERKAMFQVEIEANIGEIKNDIQKIIKNHEEMYHRSYSKKLGPIKIVDNYDWYKDIDVLQFLGGIGRNFRVGTMLGRQIVRDRLNSSSGISFAEFSYQILQAYDWLYLYEKYNCRFQIGGKDQLGNIVSGFELIDRIHRQNVYGIMIPLVTNEEGDKYGKSTGNAVWLSKHKTSPFQFYQFFIRAKDSEVRKLLLLYTFESIQRIEEIMNEHSKQPHKRLAQKILAQQVTELVHGEEGLHEAEKVSSVLYEQSLDALSELDPHDLQSAFKGAALVELLLKPGTTILEAALSANCFKTESDAIRIIAAGGFFINQQKVQNCQEILTPATHILPSNITLMRVGKKNYTIVKWL